MQINNNINCLSNQSIITTAYFSFIMACSALTILGLALSPLLKVKLLPDRALPSVTVYYNYNGANAVVADSEVTSKLEAIFSNLAGKLNNETGHHKKAVALVCHSLNKEIKVPSQAIEEIREEMRDIIDEIKNKNETAFNHFTNTENHIKNSSMLIKQQFW